MQYTSAVISGLPVSGKSVLISRLKKLLKWETYSIGDAWRAEYAQVKASNPDESRSFEEWWKAQPLDKQSEVNVKAKKVFAAGNVLGDTRYSIYCKDIPSLLVFITAGLDIRVQRAHDMGKYEGASLEEITEILKKREQDELRMGKQIFGDDFDYRNPNHYHIVLNSGTLSIGEEVKSIVNLL